MHKEIAKYNYEHIALMGDFNGTIDNTVDRSNTTSKKKLMIKGGELPKAYLELAVDLGLADVWRNKNKKMKDYTFYSSRHATWSRIDMVWTTKELEILTQKIEIATSHISDHSPVK